MNNGGEKLTSWKTKELNKYRRGLLQQDASHVVLLLELFSLSKRLNYFMCVCLIVKCSLIEQEEEYGVDHSVNNK